MENEKRKKKKCRHGGGFEHSRLALNHSPTETREEGGARQAGRHIGEGYTRLKKIDIEIEKREKRLLKSSAGIRLWSIYDERRRCISLVIDVRWLCRSC